jgi:hypothetical protein
LAIEALTVSSAPLDDSRDAIIDEHPRDARLGGDFRWLVLKFGDGCAAGLALFDIFGGLGRSPFHGPPRPSGS